MRVLLCQWVPLTLVLTAAGVSVGGCSCAETHVREDAGLSGDAELRSDVGFTNDTSAADAGHDAGYVGPTPRRCEDLAARVVCFDHVSAGQVGQLEVLPDQGCFCGQTFLCEEGAPGPDLVALHTQICPPEALCDACEPLPVGECMVRPRDEGTVRVQLDGHDAFDLEVLPADVIPERADVCVRPAQIDGCGATWPALDVASDLACHPGWVPTGTRVPIRVEEACGGCAQLGPCTVTVVDDTILVRPTILPYACEIACDPVCDHPEHLCLTPPLRDGHYTVLVRGLSMDDLDPAGTIDVSPSGGVPDEICRGTRS